MGAVLCSSSTKDWFRTTLMSRLMTKQTKCAQRRLRSAWAFAQSDQSLHCALNRKLRAQCFFIRTAKTLIRLGGCPGWSESPLGAHAILFVLSWGGSVTVLQGCLLLPSLFNRFLEGIIYETPEDNEKNYNIRDWLITHLHFTDDIVVNAEEVEETDILVDCHAV